MEECAREEENALYASTTFFVWLRFLKGARALLWIGAALGSVLAASQILRGDPTLKVWMAGAALLAVALPAIGRAVHIDTIIRDYANAAAAFKNLQGDFRRARLVWSNEPWSEFNSEARKLIRAMNEARKPSLTPPEWCFRLARRKIKLGDYDHGVDRSAESR
jgi:hypothetical protein